MSLTFLMSDCMWLWPLRLALLSSHHSMWLALLSSLSHRDLNRHITCESRL